MNRTSLRMPIESEKQITTEINASISHFINQ
jgi:hypothetical protein